MGLLARSLSAAGAKLVGMVDETIDHGNIAKDLPDRTVFYDPKNDITVVESKTTGKIMSVRRRAIP